MTENYTYNVILTEADLAEMVAHYSQVEDFTFDVETIGDERGDPWRNRVCWIAFATDGRVDVIPMGHPNGDYLRTEFPLLPSAVKRQEKGLPLREADYSRDVRKAKKVFDKPPVQLAPGKVFAALKPIMFGSAEKSGHNLGFDLQSVAKYYRGIVPEPSYFCTMWASHVLDSRNQNFLGLDDCLKREFGHVMVKGVGKDVSQHSFNEVAEYAAADAYWTYRLYRRLRDRMVREKGSKPFRLDMDVLAVTCDMELEGATMDVPEMAAFQTVLEQEIEDAKAEVFRQAGKAFAINSNAVKQQLLWAPKTAGGRGLKPRKLTPAGKTLFKAGGKPELKHWSVDNEALEFYRGVDPLVDALLTYADLNKLLTTYVVPYVGGDVTRTTGGKEKTVQKKALLDKGRIHTRFQPLTETGRFSSRNPNLQNVPNPRTKNGKAIRNFFVAPPGHKLVVADYSQIEPRIVASFSGEQRLVDAYLNEEDIYTAIAGPFGLDRAAGKVLFLSLSYGVGPDKIAATVGIPLPKAKKLLRDFEEEFTSVYKFKGHVIRLAKAEKPVPFVKTLLGRRRYLPDLKSDLYGLKSRAERQAFNTVIQGSAADIMKVAMVRAHRMIPDEAKLILTVHDELVTVTPEHLADETAEAIRAAMEGIHVLKVPLVADIKIVDRWGEAK